MEKQTKRFRFSYSDDLLLLKEFLYENPTKNPEKMGNNPKALAAANWKVLSNKNIEKSPFFMLEAFIKKDNSDQKK